MGMEKLSLGLRALDGMWGVASPLMTLSVKLRLSRKRCSGDGWRAEVQRWVYGDNGAGVGEH